MPEMRYKTRGDSSPRGKAKVYFCCHGDDFSQFFAEISDEILSVHNCAVWYLEDPNVPADSALLEALREMQLIVMPVTSNLLCVPSRALDTEFKFAMENHIPVLPLMQERGLETLFNQKCGDLQFLDKYNNDKTAISYRKKLEDYIQSVLIGDELAQRVRAEFSAYAFLSYRKKDRKYARELMALIHKFEFCRDIAIWYDEFLIPGENFNDLIKSALEKSDIFLLAVTPNIVNEPNYIMSIEYPMALGANKPIFPTELVPTDRYELQEKYEHLPRCVGANNEQEFSTALREVVERLKIREKDASAEHLYCIGLAYLNGIDVETDHARAVTLISAAAEKDYEQAADKLADMYRTGTGVKRDFAKAVVWQRKSLDFKRCAYEKHKSIENFNVYVLAAIKLAQFLVEIEQDQQAWKVSKEIVQLLHNVASQDAPLRKLSELARYAYTLGRSMKSCTGNSAGFNEICHTAIRLAEKACQVDPSVDNQYALAQVYLHLAAGMRPVEIEDFQIDYSRIYLTKACEILQELSGVDEEYDESLMHCYMALGRMYKTRADFPESQKEKLEMTQAAQSCNLRAIEIAERITQGKRDLYSLELLSKVYLNCLELMDKELEGKLRRQVVVIYKRIADERRNPASYAALAKAYSGLSYYYERQQSYTEALRYAQEACLQYEQATQITGYRTDLMALTQAYKQAARLCMYLQDTDKAQSYYEKLLHTALEAEKLSSDRADKTEKEIFWALTKLGNCATKKGDYKTAIARHQEAMERVSYEPLRWVSLDALGQLYETMGEYAQALASYENALELREKHRELCFLQKDKRELISNYYCIGRVCLRLRQNKKTSQYFAQAITLLTDLYEQRHKMHTKNAGSGNLDVKLNSSLIRLSAAVRECETYSFFLNAYGSKTTWEKWCNRRKFNKLFEMAQSAIASALEIAKQSDDL